MTRLPLAGVKVVEIAQNLAGPFAGEILARLGADVVKLERNVWSERTAPAPTRLRADGTDVRGPHDGERRGGRTADAHGDVRPRLRHGDVGGAWRAGGPRRAPADGARLGRGHLTLRDRARLAREPLRELPDHGHPARPASHRKHAARRPRGLRLEET